MAKFQGVYPALITPLTPDHRIHVPALKKLIEFHRSQHAEGFYIGGATGEGLLLDVNERKLLAEKGCEFAGSDVTKIVHIADMNFHDTIELAKHAEACGADAISALPPLYYRYNETEIDAYYKAIADSVHIPLIIYYAGAANTTITLHQFQRLFDTENICGVKWTNPHYDQLILLRQARPDITIFNGPDEMLICGLSAGANGGIGSTYNFMLPTYQGILKHFRDGNMAAALELQMKADRIIAVCLRYSVIPVCKLILREMGIDVGNPCPPMHPYTSEQQKRIRTELIEAGLELP